MPDVSLPRPVAPPPDPAEALMREWSPVLVRLHVGEGEARHAARRALANRTGFVRELLASGRVEEATLFRAIADELGLAFIDVIEPDRLMLRESHRLAALASRDGLPLVPMQGRDGVSSPVWARADIGFSAMRSYLARWPDLAGRLVVAPPSALRAAILHQTRRRLMFDAQNGLFVAAPELSARHVVNGWQGLVLGALAVGLPVSFAAAPVATMLAIHLFAALAFLSCVLLRLAALPGARAPKLRKEPPTDPAALPVYSVLVALYREREVVPQLLVALGKLQWPRSKLEIKLVCEEDDHETLSALRALRLRPGIEIVEVPAGAPRTKPKALAYALPLCSGELVTLYDAEDRPHPGQLVEAWRRFEAEGEELACLQAPLVVTNGNAGPFSRMFAFEYAGLFRALLPMLARRGLILPLGGTSNHFRGIR